MMITKKKHYETTNKPLKQMLKIFMERTIESLNWLE